MEACTTAGFKWIKARHEHRDNNLIFLLLGLMYGQYVPIITLVVCTFTLIEAAGASDDYPTLKGTNQVR